MRQFLLYAPQALPFVKTLPADAPLRQVVIGSGTGTWWEQTHLRRAVRADNPDVFFAPAYTAPLALRVPLVVTIHDVSFAAHPEWFTPREGARRRLLTRQAARSADLILTDSEFSRGEIVERLSAPVDRLMVVPPGVTCRPRAASRARTQPIVLFVGSIFNRRRLPETIAAFAQATARRPEARLVIVGADRIASTVAPRHRSRRPPGSVTASTFNGTSPTPSSIRCTSAHRCSSFSPTTKGLG